MPNFTPTLNPLFLERADASIDWHLQICSVKLIFHVKFWVSQFILRNISASSPHLLSMIGCHLSGRCRSMAGHQRDCWYLCNRVTPIRGLESNREICWIFGLGRMFVGRMIVGYFYRYLLKRFVWSVQFIHFIVTSGLVNARDRESLDVLEGEEVLLQCRWDWITAA